MAVASADSFVALASVTCGCEIINNIGEFRIVEMESQGVFETSGSRVAESCVVPLDGWKEQFRWKIDLERRLGVFDVAIHFSVIGEGMLGIFFRVLLLKLQ